MTSVKLKCFNFFIYITFALISYCICDEYLIAISTKDVRYAGTDNRVYMKFEGNQNSTKLFQLKNPIGRESDSFKRQLTNWYKITAPDVGIACEITLQIGGYDGWNINRVAVINTGQKYGRVFSVNREIDDKQSTTKALPINGEWSSWGQFGLCEVACDANGTKVRRRSCTNPMPGCGGKQCLGASEHEEPCSGPPCPTTTTIITTDTSAAVTEDIHRSRKTSKSTLIDTSSSPNSISRVSSRVASLAVVFGFSVLLNTILIIFIITVIRDKREDDRRSGQNIDSNLLRGKTDNYADVGPTYANEAMLRI